ncbi:MAG: fibronectin type III domain-containing protein [Bacteroidetes bacterium]|nr:fibronectin type III domain-containing protein [Bacteroidota bacterium]
MWNGNLYTNSGIYTGLFVNAAGCDSTHTLNLTITPSTTNTTTISSCDTYTWSVNNMAYTQSGIYSSVSGCHTEVLNLTITPSTTNTTTISSCDTYTWSVNNTAYTQSGIYSSVNGCHTEVLDLTITPSTTNTTTISSCDSYTWSVNNTAYTQSGIYSSVNGCHTEVLNLTIIPSTTNTTTITSCDTYTWSINNTAYTQSGIYSSVNGCQTEVLNLTITPSTTNTTTIAACDTYTWSVNNTAYTQSGIYSSVNGCHTEVLNLTITPSTTNTTTITSCDTYTWSVNNMAYTQSGIYNSVNGCHTEILDLTITTNVTNTSVQSACGNYFWPVNNMNYTQSGTYTYVNGCQNEVLILTIFGLPVVTASDVSACAGQAVNLMGFPAGGVFSVSNPYIGPSTTYTYTYTDNNGCIATSVPANIYISNAPPVTGVTMSNIGANTATVNWNSVPGLIWYEIRYRTVGSASWTGGGTQAAPTNFKNIIGLMAGTSYEIEVRGFCTNNASAPGPWSTTSLFATSAACPSPQNLSTSNVTKNSATLQWTAVPNANYYQIRYRLASGPGAWISGGTASGLAVSKNIIGLSASTQYEWQIRANCNPAPFSTGSWSVLDDFTTLANKPGQTDILNPNFENHVQIYPNPVQDQLNVELQLSESAEVAIMIFDMQGRMVYQVQSHLLEGLQNVSVDVSNFAKGIYQMKVFANNELLSISKFTKQE